MYLARLLTLISLEISPAVILPRLSMKVRAIKAAAPESDRGESAARMPAPC